MIIESGSTDMFRELKELSVSRPDEVPEGWYTRTAIQEDNNISSSTAHRVIKSGLKNGKIEMKTFKIKTGERIMPVPHYKKK